MQKLSQKMINAIRIRSTTISRLFEAMPCEFYELYKENRLDKSRKTLTQQEFKEDCIQSIGKYETIFFRPNDCRYIRLDDIKPEKIDTISCKYLIRALIETSPDNYQVWLYINSPTQNEDKSLEVLKTLTIEFEGDIRACCKKQLGRLPTTRNTKTQYQLPNGHFPFATLKFPAKYHRDIKEIDHQLLAQYNSIPEIATRLDEFSDYPIDLDSYINPVTSNQITKIQATTLFSSDDFYLEALREMTNRYQQTKLDRSYMDAVISKAMLLTYGYSKRDIRQTLLDKSEKANERINKEAYVMSIIKSIKKDNNLQVLKFNFID